MTGHWYRLWFSFRSHYFLGDGTLDGAQSLCGRWSLLRKEYRQEGVEGASSNCKKCRAVKASQTRADSAPMTEVVPGRGKGVEG